MLKFNGFAITLHEVRSELGEMVAIVNKGEARTPYTFKVKASAIDGLIVA
jgi:hypothetical protein